MAQKKLTKELKKLQTEPLDGVLVDTVQDDLFYWKATLSGPEGSPYEGGIFILDVKFPSEYPFKPPTITFKTPVYHPTVSNEGGICLKLIKTGWSPAVGISRVLQAVVSMLADPSPEGALVPDIAKQLTENREAFEAEARRLTAEKATGEE
eukprot:m.73210 g.73210  ORF g.73210 m.73210 type:complete len:151 (-) comp14327_c0_seq1:261-713(-)